MFDIITTPQPTGDSVFHLLLSEQVRHADARCPRSWASESRRAMPVVGRKRSSDQGFRRGVFVPALSNAPDDAELLPIPPHRLALGDEGVDAFLGVVGQ
jgi:hypothetical protein